MTMTDCSFPSCKAPAALDGLPICGRHAQAVYLAVKDKIDRASLAQRKEAARKPNGRPPRLLNSDRPGVVYFARFGHLIKIGFTTDLRARMATLKPDEVLHTTPGTMRDEKALHKRFHRLRERDEYFLPGAELLDFIERDKYAA